MASHISYKDNHISGWQHRHLWILLLGLLIPWQLHGANASPWRLGEALDAPDWLRVSGEFRVRGSHLDNPFRSGLNGSDQVLATRTLLRTEFDLNSVTLGSELQDSRHFFESSDSPLNTGMVNAVEPLQAYLRWDLSRHFESGNQADITLGRQTLDLGARRLVARNRFRNTINGFNGIRASWRQANERRHLDLFYFLPNERLPRSRSALEDQEIAFDRAHLDYQFFGLHYSTPIARTKTRIDISLFGLHEQDHRQRQSRNRRLWTPGIRWYRSPSPGNWDFELQSVYQTGTVRASANPADTEDLDHTAHFQHAALGYSFDTLWSPRLILQYDFASGDRDPADGDSNRFDTLFGARRFELGPTGIYGAFARSNLHSPGYRLILKPNPRFEFMTAHRFHWLASDRDAWTTSGLRDPTGDTDSYLGHQIEIRFRWKLKPQNLHLEAGAAHLFAGPFIASTTGNQSDSSTYSYLQAFLYF